MKAKITVKKSDEGIEKDIFLHIKKEITVASITQSFALYLSEVCEKNYPDDLSADLYFNDKKVNYKKYKLIDVFSCQIENSQLVRYSAKLDIRFNICKKSLKKAFGSIPKTIYMYIEKKHLKTKKRKIK